MTVPEKQKMGAQAVAIIQEEAKTLGIIVVDAADQYPLGKEKLIDALTRMETATGNLWELTGLKPAQREGQPMDKQDIEEDTPELIKLAGDIGAVSREVRALEVMYKGTPVHEHLKAAYADAGSLLRNLHKALVEMRVLGNG